MRRLLLSLVLSLGLAMPAQAFDPMTIIAKEIVKGIIKNFIRDRIMDGLEAQLGQCKMMMARAGIGPHAALVRGVEKGLDMGLNAAMGPSAMTSMPGMPDTKALGAAQAAAGMPDLSGMAKMANVPGIPNMPSVPAMPGMPQMALPGGVAGLSGMPAGAMVVTGAGGIPPEMLAQLGGMQGANLGSMPPEAMAMAQQMSQQAPLTPAEGSELTKTMAALAEAFPEATNGCTGADIRLMMTATVSNPQFSGMMRPVLDSFRQMNAGFAEAKRTFEQMTPEQQQDYILGMREDLSAAEPAERKVFQQMLKADFFGMPEPMRLALSESAQ